MEAVEPIVREQIRDIKPLPGFLQAFGSTEIGRFSERFLQTPESLVERLAEEYAGSAPNNCPSHSAGGYIESPAMATHNYYPYEEQNQGGYPRNRMRDYGYEIPDYMAYERYAAYGAGRPRARYGEIRCNGY
nr:IP09244p [Drosophila melanogaster]